MAQQQRPIGIAQTDFAEELQQRHADDKPWHHQGRDGEGRDGFAPLKPAPGNGDGSKCA